MVWHCVGSSKKRTFCLFILPTVFKKLHNWIKFSIANLKIHIETQILVPFLKITKLKRVHAIPYFHSHKLNWKLYENIQFQRVAWKDTMPEYTSVTILFKWVSFLTLLFFPIQSWGRFRLRCIELKGTLSNLIELKIFFLLIEKLQFNTSG